MLPSLVQERNLHGRVFGGFLMRRAFELAFSTAYLFAGTRPQTGEARLHTQQHYAAWRGMESDPPWVSLHTVEWSA